MGYFTFFWRHIGGSLIKAEKKGITKPFPSFVVDQSLKTKLRLVIKDFIKTMADPNGLHPSLRPPENVQGMTVLAKDKFKKTVKVPGIKLPKKEISLTQKLWKPFLLKLRSFKPVASLDDSDPLQESHNLILLDPAKLEGSDKKTLGLEKLQKLGFSPESLEKFELNIGYDNWSASEVLRAVLPQDADNVSSFTQIGHIAHLNLKEENLPYKHIIGEVIVDKIPSVKTVVNKLNSIDNTYRNFEMELLAGEDNYITQTKEHNCIFEMDFSKVYWNSRLSTEHQRIVHDIPEESIVYDVFAGVGPFTVPLGKKKKCTIFANDLNPHSYNSLKKNIKLNKLNADRIQTYNMDGREFIKSIVKQDMKSRLETLYASNFELSVKDQSKLSDSDISQQTLDHGDDISANCSQNVTSPATFVVMNLPALAVDFLDAFNSLLADLPAQLHVPELMDQVLPTIHCYAFCSKDDDFEKMVKQRAESVLNRSLLADTSVRIVRNVSPNKEMVCLTFKLLSDVVLAPIVELQANETEDIEPECKKPKYT